MKVVPFIAQNAAAALAEIHAQLGPEAVVLSVRPLPAQGLARLWQKNGSVEVLACIAEEGDEPTSVSQNSCASEPFVRSGIFSSPTRRGAALHDGSGRPHVFIGPPGTGKTTLLCKWMTLSVLQENRTAKVWRLDGANANTAEFLNVYAELLGVAVERFWNSARRPDSVRSPAFRRSGDLQTFDSEQSNADLLLVDLPGVQAGDAEALCRLKEQLASFPSPRVHLVLNAAYETTILCEQFRTFAPFQPEDLSFCHLDEEKRQGKLLDFLEGTNCCLRFLSTGQKIPGDFTLAGAAPRPGVGFVS